MDTQAMIIIACIVGFFVIIITGFYFTRWVFSINRQLQNQQAMIKLLIIMAKKQGIAGDEIQQIEEMNNAPL